MAATVLHECSKNSFDKVIVVWTGINRLDTVITRSLHETYPGARQSRPHYSFCTPLGDEVWYHSGGMAGSWTWDKTCPDEIRQIFKTQYLGATPQYLNSLSLSSIINTQNLLNALGIQYQMSFIYNPFADYSQTRHEHYFGTIDQTSTYFKLIDWSKIKLENTAFEWAEKDRSRLENDQLHPTRDAMRTWIDLTFDIDIAA